MDPFQFHGGAGWDLSNVHPSMALSPHCQRMSLANSDMCFAVSINQSTACRLLITMEIPLER